MHKRIPFIIFVLIFALVGCKTSKSIKADKTLQAMNKKFAALKSAPDRIIATTMTLDELVKQGGDMRAEFRAFDKEVNNLIQQRDRFRKLKANVNKSKSAFAESWVERQMTIHNDELRARARKRHATVTAQFDKVDEFVAKARAEFEPWLQKVIDIRTYLENDLNRSGIDSIVDLVPPVSRDASKVNSKIADLITELDKLSNQMAPSIPLNQKGK